MRRPLFNLASMAWGGDEDAVDATQVDRTLQLIRSTGCKSGLVFNPATPLDILKYVMDKVDIILLMSVNPGFGGQAFIPATLDKAREARKMIDESGYDIRLEIDGGVRSRRPAVLCAFTPSTRLVSIRRGREWFLLRFRGRSDRVERPRCSAQVLSCRASRASRGSCSNL